jgi:5-methyltetrahydrofolate--homocysteine methyltransferase
MSQLTPLTDAIKSGKRHDAKRLTSEAIEAQLPAQGILDALIAGMDDVGQRFQRGEIFVPEMLVAARAMKESMALLEPLLVQAGLAPAFTAVIGTVQGDLHDIGKNLVAMMWKGANFRVVDLGTNVPPEAFVAAAREHAARVVGLSALLTTTMPAMQRTVEALRAAELEGVKVVVGGAPITQAWADEIGADGFAPDAAEAVAMVRRLVAAWGEAP